MLVFNFKLLLMPSFKPVLVWVTMALLLMQFVTNYLNIIWISMMRMHSVWMGNQSILPLL